MIKVFLVEDEIMIRRGIKSSIDWEKEGYEFVGEASDGEIAYPIIIKEKPDILITDIKMPFMDGLELSRLVKKELPDLKILILSGYDEFEYAKEAISVGVTDYLLKPIPSVKLLESLSKVAKKIKSEREEKNLRTHYIQEMQENVEREKFVFFNSLISGNLSMVQALEEGRRLGMDLGGQAYNILLFKAALNVDCYASKEEAAEAFQSLEHAGEAIPDVHSFWRGVEGWAFLLIGKNDEDVKEKQKLLKNRLTVTMKRYPHVAYFGGIGAVVSRIREMTQSYQEAALIFANRFTCEEQLILSMEELRTIQESAKLDAQSLDIMKRNRTLIEKFLMSGMQEEAGSFVEAYFGEIPKENLRSLLMRQYITIDIYIVISSFCERLGVDAGEDEAEELERTLQSVTSAEGLKKYVEQLLVRALERRDISKGRRYSDIIEAAKQYIEENYMAEDISLNSVSASVNMSPSYFSAVFSREVEKTFVEYLTETRMERAKALLMCSSKKASEIGFEVGYKDPHYFSYIFKKTEGCSPTDYRQRAERYQA